MLFIQAKTGDTISKNTAINSVDKEIVQKDAIFGAVHFAAEHFLSSKNFEAAMPEVLSRLGTATSADRVYIFENHLCNKSEKLCMSQKYEWTAECASKEIENPDLQNMVYAETAPRWQSELPQKHIIHGLIKNFPDNERELLELQNIKSIAVVPIFVNDSWWGFIGYDDCCTEKKWSEIELKALNATACIIGSAISNQKMFDCMRQAEEKYKSLYVLIRLMCDNAPDMIWAKDLQKRYIFANRAICEKLLCAKDTEEPIGKTDIFFAKRERENHPNDPEWHTFGEMCADSDSIVIKSEKEGCFEECGNIKGNFLALEVCKAPFYAENNEFIGVVGCGRDITKEFMLKKEIKESEEKFRILTEFLLSGMFIQQNNRFVHVNPAFADIFGYETSEIISMTEPLSLLIPEERETLKKMINDNLYENHSGFVQVYRGSHRDGRILYLEIRSSPVEYRGLPALIGSVIDITDRVELEKQQDVALKQIEKNLCILATLNDEIRNPLSVISSYVELSEDEYRNYIFEQIGLIDSIINKVDQGFAVSDKIREFMYKHHNLK